MPRLTPHSLDALRSAICKFHGGFDEASAHQLMSHYRSLDRAGRKRIDDAVAEHVKASKPPKK